MKRIFGTIILALAAGILSQAAAQSPVSGIRARSGELDDVKQIAETSLSNDRDKDKIEALKVKKYFERIQKLRDSIVEAYATGEKVDYPKIDKSAGKIAETAIKLKAVLFSTAAKNNQSSDKKTEDGGEQALKELIAGLDNAIRRFGASPVIQTQKADSSEIFRKALFDLEEIIRLSRELEMRIKAS